MGVSASVAMKLEAGEGVACQFDIVLTFVCVEIDFFACRTASRRQQAVAREVETHIGAHLANSLLTVRR